jgi:NAD(P)-dependent dehydrogenase (short-subunit alcohol dehydrogenase family)
MSTQCVLITGASSGIGKAAAERFAKAGATVALLARRGEQLQALARTLPSGKALAIPVDLTNAQQVERAVTQAIERLGGLDVVVNAAGNLRAGSIETTTLEEWDATMSLNLRAMFQVMRLAVPHLKATRGNIVNVSSVNGMRSFAGVLAYNVSKAGVDHLTRCVALELAPYGVRVNAVNPGVTLTSLHRAGGMAEDAYAAFLERSKTTHPLGRVGNATEVAELIFFLASENAGWITGATVSIDGGRHLTCAR